MFPDHLQKCNFCKIKLLSKHISCCGLESSRSIQIKILLNNLHWISQNKPQTQNLICQICSRSPPPTHIWEWLWETSWVAMMAREITTVGWRQVIAAQAVTLTHRLNSPSVSTLTAPPPSPLWYLLISWQNKGPLQAPVANFLFHITFPLRRTLERKDTEPSLQSHPKSLLTV